MGYDRYSKGDPYEPNSYDLKIRIMSLEDEVDKLRSILETHIRLNEMLFKGDVKHGNSHS